MKRVLFFLLVAFTVWGQELALPNKPDSLHFAVIGDSGTGDRNAYEIAALLTRYREKFPFDIVLMLGDNMYGGDKPKDYTKKFEDPYKALLGANVKFYATLGNHDDTDQTKYKLFNMNGERYYSFKPRNGVRFFALDSNYMDPKQLEWFENQLKASGSEWKIVFFHHPLYSSGMHGSATELRAVLEPLLTKYGADLVLAGHEHFYERIKPQHGINYIISGGAAKLRRGDIARTALTAKGFDQDNHFMLFELDGERLHFQAISRAGKTIDAGILTRREVKQNAAVSK